MRILSLHIAPYHKSSYQAFLKFLTNWLRKASSSRDIGTDLKTPSVGLTKQPTVLLKVSLIEIISFHEGFSGSP